MGIRVVRAEGVNRGSSRAPSSALLKAAVSGLLGLSGAACASEEEPAEDDPNPHEGMHPQCGDGDGDGGAGMGGGDGDGDGDAEPVKEIGDPEDVQLSWAELSSMCDDRDGYIQIHASCSGVNTCQGFTYGDWGADSQLQEHSCSGVNGCAGLSCVTTAEDDGLTGEEIMKLEDDFFIERTGQYGAKSCKTCHVPSEHDPDLDDYVYDFSKLRLHMWPDKGRDASNWTERSAAVQERIVAFGAQGMTDDGVHYSNMAPNNKALSKAEIKRVVQYMREFAEADIVVEEIKVQPGFVEGED